MQFDDEFVKAHYAGQFETAEDLRKSLLATTAMERVQQLDQALGEAVQKVRDLARASPPPAYSLWFCSQTQESV